MVSWFGYVTPVVSDSLRPMDCSPPGSSVHGILQARILEWAAMPPLLLGIFSTQGLNPSVLRLLHWQAGSLPPAPPGKPPAPLRAGKSVLVLSPALSSVCGA